MRLRELTETATAGSTSAGAIASIASVPGAKRKTTKKKNGTPVAPQASHNGIAKNALDMNTNIFGGPIKR